MNKDKEGFATRQEFEKLEVEDEENRQNRIQSTLEKLNSTSPTHPKQVPIFSSFDFGDRKIHPLPPQTDILCRVQAFLPQIEASNSLLAQRMELDPDSVDIEHIEDGINHYIEMNLGLGVFEDRSSQKADGKRGSNMSSSDSSESSEMDQDNGNNDDSDFDSDASSEIITSFLPSRPIRPLPRRFLNKTGTPSPQIVVLGEKS